MLTQHNLNRRGFLKQTSLLGLAASLADKLQGAIPARPASKFDAVLAKYPKLPPAPVGKGIFAHVKATTGELRHDPEVVRSWAGHPHISGTQLSYCWARLEPEPRQYRWDIIEADMDIWARNGKKCWLEVSTAGRWWANSECDPGTPQWVYDQGVPFVKAPKTATYPVFWDGRYLKEWEKFIHAFARRFDGDPRVEFFAPGGYSNGTEPKLSSKEDDQLMDQWKQHGFDGFTASGIYLSKGVKPVLKFFFDAFKRTPVGQTYVSKGEFTDELNRYATQELKFFLKSNGQGMRSANPEGRQAWRDRREKYGVKVGYAEWGPSGRIADEAQFQLKKEKKRQAEEKQDYSATIQLDPAKMAKLIEVYRGLIGDDNDPSLRPSARLSYLAFGERIPEAETEEEWNAGLKWAWEHLEA